MAQLNPRLSLFEQQVLAKLDTLIANSAAQSNALLTLVEDHLRYLRISDMRRYGTVQDSENLPPAYVDQP